jgi:ribosomal-protein-alanine N-acetyltransferase
VKLRAATLEDAAAIAAIEALGATPGWDAAAVDATLRLPTTCAIVADAGGRVIGHLISAVVAGEAEILIVAVHPGERRRGIGRALLDEARARWERAGVSRAVLEVRADNDPALTLYARAGWERCGLRRRYYRDGTDAALLALDLNDGSGTATGS